jgi:hypothetical protein
MSSLGSRIAMAAAVLALALPSSSLAQGIAYRRAAFHNQKGGVTAVSGTAAKGPNGAEAVHGRAVSTDVEGNVTTAHGGAFKGPSGAKVAHEGRTTVSPNGSATHEGSSAASGANGSIKSTGSAQRGTGGSASSYRTTKVTGKNGNSATEDKTWVKGQGVTRTAACTDAAGNVITCKR